MVKIFHSPTKGTLLRSEHHGGKLHNPKVNGQDLPLSYGGHTVEDATPWRKASGYNLEYSSPMQNLQGKRFYFLRKVDLPMRGKCQGP